MVAEIFKFEKLVKHANGISGISFSIIFVHNSVEFMMITWLICIF